MNLKLSGHTLGPDSHLPMSLHFLSGCSGNYFAAGVGGIQSEANDEDGVSASGLHMQILSHPG